MVEIRIKTSHDKYWGVVCKISDFGFTSVEESGKEYSSIQGRMTIIYSAPELLLGKFSKKCDIWAMGCILYEVCFVPHSRRRAFDTLGAIISYYYDDTIPPPQIGWEVFGVKPESIPEDCKIYRHIVQRRWDGLNILFAAAFRRNPSERPTAVEFRDDLELVAKGEATTLADYRPGRNCAGGEAAMMGG